MRVLVDTCIFIDVLREKVAALEWMKRFERIPSISVVTLAELVGGAKSQREEDEIRSLVGPLHLLPVGGEIAVLAGAHRKHFAKSHSVELGDALIAATAEYHGLALVTLNVKHFPMFKRLRAPY